MTQETATTTRTLALTCKVCGAATIELTPPVGPGTCLQCGATVVLCKGCGNRTKWNGGPCGPCHELPEGAM